MFPKSIRWQIQAFHGALLLILVTGLIAGFYTYEKRARYHQLDTQLLEMVPPLLPRLSIFRPGGGPGGPRDHRPPPRGPEADDDFPPPPHLRERPDPEEDPVMAPYQSGKFYYISWTPDLN